MSYQIDPASAVPPYEQLRSQLAEAIRSGELGAGAKLPTVRALAEELHLAVTTVARSVKELEAASLVITRGRAGTVVAYSAEAELRRAQEAATAFATAVAGLGIGPEEALDLARKALHAQQAH